MLLPILIRDKTNKEMWTCTHTVQCTGRRKYRIMNTYVALHVGEVSIEGLLQQQGTQVIGDTVEPTGGDDVYPRLLSLLPILSHHLLHELG